LSDIVAQPSFVVSFPSERNGIPELKSRPALSPKYHIAASFEQTKESLLDIELKQKKLLFS
jgi:hypothetical protein